MNDTANTTTQYQPAHAGFLTPEENHMNDQYLPNATNERLENPDYADDMRHGIDCYEFPSDSALQLAKSRVHQLEQEPLTAYILTHNLHDFMIEMQHWIRKGWFVGDSSALVCRDDLQSAQLYKTLF